MIESKLQPFPGSVAKFLDYDRWDRQMVADFSPGGRAMALVESVRREIVQGKAVPFEEGLEQAETKRNPQRR